jgi:hypothetical protein
MRPELALFVEIALWLRWARSRDDAYWKRVHDWYHTEYLRMKTQDGKREMAIAHRNWVMDALDDRFLPIHMGYNFLRSLRRLLEVALPSHLKYQYGWNDTVTKALQEM